MSNLLDRSSLVLTPTAYNNGEALCIKPDDASGDFQFSRNSAATRVNAQGLVENVQILSSNLVQNGDFSEQGSEEVSNGSFSQEGSQLITNGDFSSDTDWNKETGWTITGGNLVATSVSGTAAYQVGSGIVLGKTYKVKFEITEYTAGAVGLRAGTGSTLQTFNSIGVHSAYMVASGALQVRFDVSGTTTLKIDNVSCVEVGQDWSLGTGWSIGENKAERLVAAPSTDLVQFNMSWNFTSTYKISFDVEASAGSVRARIGQTNLNYVGQGTHTFYAIPSGNNQLKFQADSAFVGSITNISIKEVGQNWDLGTGWSIGDDKANAIVASDGQFLTSNTILTIGSKYKLTFSAVVTSGEVRHYNGGFTGITANTTGTFTGTFTATETILRFYSSAFVGSITNISIIEITTDTNLPRINYENFSYQDALGNQLVTNGSFDSDTAWFKLNGSTISGGVGNVIGNGDLGSTGNNWSLNQNTGMTLGSTYKVSFSARQTVGTGNFQVAQAYQKGFNQSISSVFVNYSFYTTPLDYGGNTGVISFGGLTVGDTFEIDNVSVKEYLGKSVVPESGCGSWLFESQSTNIIAQSELFSDAVWNRVGASVTSGFLSPDGNLNAFKMTETASTGVHYVGSSDIGVTLGNDTTFSVFVKKGESNFIQLLFSGASHSSSNYANFDLLNGVLGSVGGGVAKIEFIGGFYRCSFTSQATATTATNAYIWKIQSATSPRAESYTGDGTSGVYIYGAQLEVGNISSYIPTQGSSVTRNQDLCNNGGSLASINSTEGVLYAEAAYNNSGIASIISLTDGTNNNRVMIYWNTNNTIIFFIRVNSSYVAEYTISSSEVDVSSFNKLAIKYKTNDMSFWLNGTKVATDTNGTMFNADTLTKLAFNSGSGGDFYGKTKALAVWKTALSDQELADLTYPTPTFPTFTLDFNTIAEQFTFARGSEATYVDAQGLIQSTASNNAPRLDSSTGAEEFLLEPQSTNLYSYSEDFSNAAWTKSAATVVITSNVAPDGTTNSVYNLTGTNANLYTGGTTGVEYTVSVYAKSNGQGKDNFKLRLGNSISSSITVTDEWVRYQFTATPTTTVFGLTVDSSPNNEWDILIWGSQLEQKSYATSYIKSEGSQTTRNQETCINATPEINSEEGVLYAEIAALSNDLTFRTITLSDGTTNNNVGFGYRNNSNVIYTFLQGVINSSSIVTVSDITSVNKVAIKYKSGDFSMFVNGIKVFTSTIAFTLTGLNELSFDNGAGAANFFGNTKDLQVYTKALSDAELIKLTTI